MPPTETTQLIAVIPESLADLAARINAAHNAAAVALKSSIAHAIRAGELLIKAKEKVDHGEWLPWLKDNFPFSDRTARLYMQIARMRPEIDAKMASVADLTLRDVVEWEPISGSVEMNTNGTTPAAAKETRAAQSRARHIGRIAKLAAISNNNAPLPTDRRFPVLLADPAWAFAEGTADPSRRIEKNHYPTMASEKICDMPVKDLATPDAILFLYTPSSHLPDALQVMQAWDFKFQTTMVWMKNKIGMGHWVRNRRELVLIGTRGNMPHPAPSARPDSVIEAPRRGHSVKPVEIYNRIERMYPTLPKVELFARQTRPAWAAWGNEIEQGPDAKRGPSGPPKG